MKENELYETIGRLTMQLEDLNDEYDRLLEVLRQVVTGEVKLECVTADIAGRTWAVATDLKAVEETEH